MFDLISATKGTGPRGIHLDISLLIKRDAWSEVTVYARSLLHVSDW